MLLPAKVRRRRLWCAPLPPPVYTIIYAHRVKVSSLKVRPKRSQRPFCPRSGPDGSPKMFTIPPPRINASLPGVASTSPYAYFSGYLDAGVPPSGRGGGEREAGKAAGTMVVGDAAPRSDTEVGGVAVLRPAGAIESSAAASSAADANSEPIKSFPLEPRRDCSAFHMLRWKRTPLAYGDENRSR